MQLDRSLVTNFAIDKKLLLNENMINATVKLV